MILPAPRPGMPTRRSWDTSVRKDATSPKAGQWLTVSRSSRLMAGIPYGQKKVDTCYTDA